jgi:hypothetical protein
MPEYGPLPAARASGLIDYVNLPPMIGVVISENKATLCELQSVYGVGDLFNLCEVIAVDGYNRRILSQDK